VWPSRAALINAFAPLSVALKILWSISGFSALNKSRSCWAPESLVRTSLKTSNLNGEVLYKFIIKKNHGLSLFEELFIGVPKLGGIL
jgi:hypothetical protein